jgi:hypothetical protein
MTLVPIREVLAPIIDAANADAPRRPRYWAEGPFVVSSSRRRMPIYVALDALGHLVRAAIASPDDLLEADLLLVSDMIRAIRKAEGFTPPTPAGQMREAA